MDWGRDSWRQLLDLSSASLRTFGQPFTPALAPSTVQTAVSRMNWSYSAFYSFAVRGSM